MAISGVRWRTVGAGFALFALQGIAPPARADVPRLAFAASFDQGGDADFARGRREGSAGCTNTARSRGRPGRVLVADRGAPCSFAAAENLPQRAGTLSFWAQPWDWLDGEGRSQILFRTTGTVAGQYVEMYVDSPPERSVVRLLVLVGNWQDTHRRLFQIQARADWDRGWQKIDVTWDGGDFALYVNGERGESFHVEEAPLVGARFDRFDVTSPGLFGEPADRTAIDRFEIWDGALPPERIRMRYLAEATPRPLPPELAVPRASPRVPRIDGTRTDAEWAHAARLPLLADAEHGFLAQVTPTLDAVWDRSALYLAVDTLRTDRDSPRVDAVEFLVLPEDGPAKKLVVRRDGRSQPTDVRVQVRSSEVAWGAEIAIPAEWFGLSALAPDRELRVAARHLAADPGSLGLGAALGTRLAPALLRLSTSDAGVRVAAASTSVAGALALTVSHEGGVRAQLAANERATASEGGLGGIRLEHAARVGSAVDPLRLDVRGMRGDVLAQLPVSLASVGGLGVEHRPRESMDAVELRLHLAWLDGAWRSAFARGEATARVEHERRGAPPETISIVLRDLDGTALLETGLAPGPHRGSVVLADARGRTLDVPIRFEVPELPWLTAALPSVDVRLEPWTALAAGERDARVWNRHYALAGPLLAGATDPTGDLLRGPMTLKLRAGGVASSLRTTEARREAASDVRGVWSGEAEFPGTGFRARWSLTVEYDGLVLSHVEIEPPRAGATLESLELDVPLKPQVARWLRGTRDGSQIRNGRVPWDGRAWVGRFEPFVWLTNDSRGFVVFSQSDANWVAAETPGAVEVRGGTDAGITMRMVRAPTSVPGPLTYEIGFQATPVKPEAADARTWNLGVGGERTPGERAIAYYDGFGTLDGVWEAARPAAAARADRSLRARRAPPFYYATVSAVPDGDPAFRLFESLWRSAWAVSYVAPPKAASEIRSATAVVRLAAARAASPSLQARLLFDADHLLRDVGAYGLYTDTDEVFADDSPDLACGFPDAFGRRGLCWPILAKRQFAKRLAALVRRPGDRRYWLSHAHAKLVPPVHGFADLWLPGEEQAPAMQGRPWYYADGVAEDAWQLDFRGASSGVTHVLLPQLGRGTGNPADMESSGPTEALVARAAVHDVNVAALWANRDVVGEYWRLRDRLRLATAHFTGFWQPTCPIRALTAGARASAYRTSAGTVVVVANEAADEQQVALSIDSRVLPTGTGAVRDERRGSRIPVDRGRVIVTVGGRSYTYLSVEAR